MGTAIYKHYEATIYCEDGTQHTEDIAAESYTEAEAIAMELAQDYEDVWNVYVKLYDGIDC